MNDGRIIPSNGSRHAAVVALILTTMIGIARAVVAGENGTFKIIH